MEISLDRRREKLLDIPPHFHQEFVGRFDCQWILTHDTTHIGFVHEENEIVITLGVQINVLKELMRGDGSSDVCRISMCCTRRLRSCQQYAAEVGVHDMRSQSFELSQQLNKGFAHETVNEAVNAWIVHVGRTRADPPPKVINGKSSRTFEVALNSVKQPSLDHGLQNTKCLSGNM